MPDAESLGTYVGTLGDQELLKLRSEGGFTEEAERILDGELARRNLTPEHAKRAFAPEWLERADAGKFGVLTLDDGEQFNVEVVGLNEDGDRLSVRVMSSENLLRNGRRSRHSFPLQRIISFDPQSHLMERWPYSDPCRERAFSLPRFILMAMIFVSMVVGSLPPFLLLAGRPYGVQEASSISYTLFQLFFTFAATRDLPPFKFKCPAVEPQLPRLILRHFAFLVVLFALQTALLAIHPHLPDGWSVRSRKGVTPFDFAMLWLCMGLGLVEVFSSRALLRRAHRQFPAQDAG